jgi:hypothetical protein
MKPIDNTKENMYIQDPKAVEDKTQRVKTILEAKYEAADLNEIVKSCQHLNLKEQKQLLNLLTKYKTIFDGTLGLWKGEN